LVADAGDLATGISRAADKHLCLVEARQQADR